PVNPALGDVNGDGKPDLAVANYGSDTLSVLFGNGDGTFQAQKTFTTGSDPNAVTLGDVNGDGKPDLVTVNYGSDSVSVLYGNATLQTQQPFPTRCYPDPPMLAALSGVGGLDITVAALGNLGTNLVGVLLGNGNGTFQTEQNFATGSGPSTATVGDVNGDGKP